MKQVVQRNDSRGLIRIFTRFSIALIAVGSLASCITYYPVSYSTHQLRQGNYRGVVVNEDRNAPIDREGAVFYENYFAEKAAQLALSNEDSTFTDIDTYSSGAENTYAQFGENEPKTRITINQFNSPFSLGWGSAFQPMWFNNPWANPWMNPWVDPFFNPFYSPFYNPFFGPSTVWNNRWYSRRFRNNAWGYGWFDPYWGRPLVYGYNPRRVLTLYSVRPRTTQGYRSGPTRSNPYYVREADRGRSNLLPTRSRSSYTPQSNTTRNTYSTQRNSNYRSTLPTRGSSRSMQQPSYNRSRNSAPTRISAPVRSSGASRSGSTRSSSSRSNSRGNN